MSIMDAIGRARGALLTDYRQPVRIWLVPDDFCALMYDAHIMSMDPRSRTFMGMPFTECSPRERSRVVAADGTAIYLEEKSA